MNLFVQQDSLNKRNVTLDIIKVIAAFSVICIHYMFSGEVGIVVKAVARFAVPFFFTISGFFAYGKNHTTMIEKAKHILKIYLLSFLLYFVYGAAREMLLGRASGIIEYVTTYLRVETIFNFLIYNTTISAAHLWFLPALVYCYLIFYVIKKLKISDGVLMFISLCLLAFRLLVGEVLGFFAIESNSGILPNFIFIGLPFFSMGMLLKKNQSKLIKIPNIWPYALLFAGILETVLSVLFFKPHIAYLGTPLIVFALIVFAMKYGDKKYSDFIFTVSTLSTYIYVFHVAIGGTLETIISRVTHWGDSVLWINTKPFVVFVLSVALSMIFKMIVDILRNIKGRASQKS